MIKIMSLHRFENFLPKVGIISQARMTSSRLPGKVMKQISGKSLLHYHCERLAHSGLPIVLATTTNSTDDVIVDFSKLLSIPFFRGDEKDVLSRYYGAAVENNLDVIVRVTSDCPLIDGKLIKSAVDKYMSTSNKWLYMSNGIERTYPRGFDFEIFSLPMLKEAFEKSTSPSEREHVTPYFYQNRHGLTQFEHIKQSSDMSSYRLTVDEADDFKLIEKLITDFHCEKLSADEICSVLLANPELKLINQHIEQKKL
jgi:spore coat polysaccharide biosynthesis protein SpsF